MDHPIIKIKFLSFLTSYPKIILNMLLDLLGAPLRGKGAIEFFVCLDLKKELVLETPQPPSLLLSLYLLSILILFYSYNSPTSRVVDAIFLFSSRPMIAELQSLRAIIFSLTGVDSAVEENFPLE